MLDRFPIVSGAHAGRMGPLRAASGCECGECSAFREARNERLRERYATEPAYAERERERSAAAYAANADAINARSRQRYREDEDYAEAKRAAYWRNPEAKRARERARYRRQRHRPAELEPCRAGIARLRVA